MNNIYNSDEAFSNFDFNKLVLTKPAQSPGGNYFIKFLVDSSPLYVQPSKCSTKQGIIKAGKRFYSDLMFTNENEIFINWMEKLETHCQQYIYDNRSKWFESDMELHDIENYFASPVKIYKSGKYYIVRSNVSTVLGKPTLKIYDEEENEVSLESITDKMDIMTILEIQGIKCSSRSFQIEIEIRQMMVLKPKDLFEKCLFKSTKIVNPPSLHKGLDSPLSMTDKEITTNLEHAIVSHSMVDAITNHDIKIEKKESSEVENATDLETQGNGPPMIMKEEPILEEPMPYQIEVETNNPLIVTTPPPLKIIDGMEEVEFHLEELPESDTLHLKHRNDVYYELYREAKRKAKIAKDFAISSYLEAKEIKNKYMLDEIDDSDEDEDYSDEEGQFDFEEIDKI
jgi:hypothetical protein